VATVDAGDTEHADGYVAFAGGRITAVGAGRRPAELDSWTRTDGAGLLVTPGLVNAHHHRRAGLRP
jgi:cytosine/adenosine deaminase-related metal-dependent hydrolase